MEFQRYKHLGFVEARPVTKEEINLPHQELQLKGISISQVDVENHSPKQGDMIARNPQNPKDQWLIAEKYWNENYHSTLIESSSEHPGQQKWNF
jgi:hypothetical protein